MDDAFKIYIEQLRDGHSEKIEEAFTPEFLEVNEKEVSFKDPVFVKGRAYLADADLVLNFDIKTVVTLPCRVCNEPAQVVLKVKDLYHAIPTQEIRSGIFNFKELLRETILLEIPPVAECNGGQCPKRTEIKKYLRSETSLGDENTEGYNPFADFDWDKKIKE